MLPIIISAWLLFPTYRAYELGKIHDEYELKAKQAKSPEDSLAVMEEFETKYGEDFLKAKNSKLKLGLDLRGGMYVTLEIDVLKLIEESAMKESVDDVFTEAIEKTRAAIQSSDVDVVDEFKRNFDAAASSKKRVLADYFTVSDNVKPDEMDKKIIEKLKFDENDAIDQAMQVIRQRIDKFGIAEPTIQKQGSRRIMLELPGVTNEAEMRQLLQTTARLEFKLVRTDEVLIEAFFKIDQYLARELRYKAEGKTVPAPVVKADSVTKSDEKIASSDSSKKPENAKEEVAKAETPATDSTKSDSTAVSEESDTSYAGLSEEDARKKYQKDHPFYSLFTVYFIPEGKNQRPQPVGFMPGKLPKGDYSMNIFEPQLKKFMAYMSRKDIQILLPDGVQVLIGAKADKEHYKDANGKIIKMYNLYGVKKSPELTGEVIVDAIATYDPQTNQPVVSMEMNSTGADAWGKITGANIQKRIAIVLDEQVYSAPVVQNKITGGHSQITGMSSPEEAKLLKIVLKAGALKAPVQLIEERVVGPSLGEDSIRSGLTSILVAVLLVILFMTIYYAMGGLVADFAVIINVIVIVAIMAAFQGTLSMPGIAGIILTLGMAVDANVLVYERIREEMWKGRGVRSAIDEGFSKAMTAILDSNITTFITGVILYFFGTGAIQGFALTLMIGILVTLFTQIVLTRACIELTMPKGAATFNFGQPKQTQITE